LVTVKRQSKTVPYKEIERYGIDRNRRLRIHRTLLGDGEIDYAGRLYAIVCAIGLTQILHYISQVLLAGSGDRNWC
jgi:hypothetical protein